ncbi:MAG TPA: hypothetical protein VF755_14385 [Catenuloplanes sp.]|jgi:hypothetical protein
MNGPLSTATVVVSLLVAAWCAVDAVRDRPPSRGLLAAVWVVEAVAVALVGTAVLSILAGDRPAEVETFLGYVITFVSIPVTGWVLARMEPTRWGAVTLGVALLVMPVLVLRLQQLWAGPGA